MPVVLIDTERIAQTKLGRVPGSRLTNRSRWRGQRFWLATRRDAGRIPAAGFNRGTTTWPGKRSAAPAHLKFPIQQLHVPLQTPLQAFMRWFLKAFKLQPAIQR